MECMEHTNSHAPTTESDETSPRSAEEDGHVTAKRWVRKNAGAWEMGISLSTLERRIKSGEMEARKEGNRVEVAVYGPEPVTDRDRLEDLRREFDECKQTVEALSERESWLRKSLRRADQDLEASQRWAYDLLTERNQLRLDFREGHQTRRFLWRVVWFLFLIAVYAIIVIAIQTIY